MPDVYVSRFAKYDKPAVVAVQELSWDQLCKAFTQHTTVSDKEGVQLFNFCRFSTPYRKNINVVDVSSLLLDVDDKTLEEVTALADKLAPYAYAMHSTHRHGILPGKYRLRFAVRLSRAVLGQEWGTFARGVKTWLGDALDGCVVSCSQSYYLPAKHPDREALSHVNPGEPLPVDTILEHTPYVENYVAETPDTWRPLQVFTVGNLKALPGDVAARVLRGEPLAPEGKRHPARRGLVFQFLCEYGPGAPDGELLQLLVNSANAPRETWISAFTSGSARAKAEAQHQHNLVFADQNAQTIQAADQFLQQAKEEAQKRVAAAARVSKQASAIAYTSDEVRERAKKCKDPAVKKVLISIFSPEGVPFEYENSLEEAGRWLAKKEPTRELPVLQKAFSGTHETHKLALFRGLEIGHAQATQREAWRTGLHMASDEKPSASEPNVRKIFREHPDMRGVLVWDVRKHALRLFSMPPWERTNTSPYLTDSDRGAASEWLANEAGIAVGFKVVGTALQSLAHELPQYDPMKVWAETLVWDEIPRCDLFLSEYCGAENSEYTRTVGAKTLIGAVARIYEPGCKQDTVLVLEGGQGVRKSTAIQALCPTKEFFRDVDGALSGDNKDLIMRIVCGTWIIELGELHGASRSDVHRTKAFLSRTEDTYRPPYAASTETHPRATVFIATTNENDYLGDGTGNRRWYPVKVLACRPDAIARDREQIWAEAVARYKAGEPWWIDAQDAIHRAVLEQQQRREDEDALAGQVSEYIEHLDVVCHAMIAVKLGLKIDDRHLSFRFRKILTRLGWVRMDDKEQRNVVWPHGPGVEGGVTKSHRDRFWRKAT